MGAALWWLLQLWESKMQQSKAIDNLTADQNLIVNRHKQQQAAAQALQRTTAVGIPTTGATHLHQPQGEYGGWD